jgi:hypothetical protein
MCSNKGNMSDTTRNTQATKLTIFFLKYLYYNMALNIPTCFDPQGIIIREQTKAILQKKENKLATFINS